MLKKLLFLLLFLSFLTIGCQQKVEVAKAHLFYTGIVDSIKIFPASQNVGGDFMFDPLKGQDKIWTFNYSVPLELDLHTGMWTPLSDIYHERLSAPLHGEPIWKDSLTNEVFILNYNEGLIHLICDSCPVNFYPLPTAQCVLNAEDQILIGTTGGLYTVDKINKGILKVPQFPIRGVSDIQVLNDDTLITNNGFFPYPLKNPSRMIHFAKDPGMVYNNPFINLLPFSDQASQYRLRYSGTIPFMYSSARLFFQDSTKTVFEIRNRPQGYLRHLKTDSAYIYLLYDDAFVILNKAVAMRNADVFDVSLYDKNRREVQQKINSLHTFSLDTFIIRYQQFQEDSMIQSSPEFTQLLDQSIAGYFIYNRWEKDISIVERAIEEKNLPPELEKYAIISVCMKYVRTGVWDKLPAYCAMLKERYPDFDYYGSKSGPQCVLPIKKSLDSLNNLNLAEDAYWFEKAKLMEKLLQCGWTGDDRYDYSIVSDNYKKILSKYPNGKYGDNAAFYFISQMQYGDEGDEYSTEQIAECNKFLEKYPLSELKPNVRYLMARNYNAYFGDQDTMIVMMEIALNELIKIDQHEVKDTNVLREINFFKTDISNRMMSLCFEIILRPQKTDFKAGEDIKISVLLKNKTSTVRSIRMFSNGPGWISVVRPEDQTTFMTTKMPIDTTTRLVSVMPNETLFQELTITQAARHWKDPGIGRYELQQPGSYYISVRDPTQKLNSSHINIYFYN